MSAKQNLNPQLFDTSQYEGQYQRPQTYTDTLGRSRLATTDVLPEWWHNKYGDLIDPDYNLPNDIMDATRHIRGVDEDFVVVDKNWLPDDREDAIWHGSGSRISDDYVSSARTVGQTGRYDGMGTEEEIKEYRGGYHDADKVWGSTPRIARDYAGGKGNTGYMYGLNVTGGIDYTMDGYAFDEDENEITHRYKFGDK